MACISALWTPSVSKSKWMIYLVWRRSCTSIWVLVVSVHRCPSFLLPGAFLGQKWSEGSYEGGSSSSTPLRAPHAPAACSSSFTVQEDAGQVCVIHRLPPVMMVTTRLPCRFGLFQVRGRPARRRTRARRRCLRSLAAATWSGWGRARSPAPSRWPRGAWPRRPRGSRRGRRCRRTRCRWIVAGRRSASCRGGLPRTRRRRGRSEDPHQPAGHRGVANENRTWASRQMDNGNVMGREGKVEVGDLEVWRNRWCRSTIDTQTLSQ